MYAVEATVRRKARNVTANLTPEDIQAIGNDVDAEIDGLLGTVFYWPYDSKGVDLRLDPDTIPQQIVTAANLIVAGVLEQEQFARTNDGMIVPNYYGQRLEKQGRLMIEKMISFEMDVPGLEAEIAVRQTPPQKPAFFPVSGFGTERRQGFDRFRRNG